MRGISATVYLCTVFLITVVSAGYNEDYARKLFNMAAAAHGNEDAIKTCLNKTFTNNDYVLLRNLQNVACTNAGGNCQGFLAVSDNLKNILISYRGTVGFDQFFAEIKAVSQDTKPFSSNDPSYGRVFSYFYDTFDFLYDTKFNIDAILNNPQYATYTVSITGHSLGGSLASLTALRIVQRKLRPSSMITVITFGEPRTGDYTFAKNMDNSVTEMYRVVHNNDPIPHLPMCSDNNGNGVNANCYQHDYAPYHQKTEIWYHNDDMSPRSYTACQIGEDPTCSDSLKWNDFLEFWKNPHVHYFQHTIPYYGEHGCEDAGTMTSLSTVLTVIVAVVMYFVKY